MLLPLVRGRARLRSCDHSRVVSLLRQSDRDPIQGCRRAQARSRYGACDRREVHLRETVHKAAPLIAVAKPALAPKIASALKDANVARYPDSMRHLVQKGIHDSLLAIERLAVRRRGSGLFIVLSSERGQAERGCNDESDAADDACSGWTDKGIGRPGQKHCRRCDAAVHGPMGQHCWKTAFRAQGKPAEQAAQHHAEPAHSRDAEEWPARVVKPVVVAECRYGCVPQAPDDADCHHRERDAVLLQHVGKKIAAPAPLTSMMATYRSRGR